MSTSEHGKKTMWIMVVQQSNNFKNEYYESFNEKLVDADGGH